MRVKVTVLVDDVVGRRGTLAEHGLSLLAEIGADGLETSVLLDAGTTPSVFRHNVEVLGVDLSKVDAIVVSHGHYDHMGGLLEALRMVGRRIPVIVHPNAFTPKLAYREALRWIGGPTLREIRDAGGIPLVVTESVILAKRQTGVEEKPIVMTTGEIPRISDFEKVEEFWTVIDGRFVRDEMPDDQAVVIRGDEGIVLLTGCAHSGIINTAWHAQKIAKMERIKAIIGGFHLMSASLERIERTVQELTKLNPELMAPGHCTGLEATNAIMRAFGDRCRPISTGAVIELEV